MKTIEIEDAENVFLTLLDDAIRGDDSVITHQGERVAVILSYDKYQRLKQTVPSLGWLLANAPLEEDDLPVRKPARCRLLEF
ncbi:type II toxin-antitoxin system Phd/YefM family antitoxin [Rhizobium leucaenae]|uniref:Antitoxin n=1 Tax=Rhizobium leucaenae TaxID=29450 RepID=A0A7W6ZRT6_9HYPH|nr:type II toxin-antitoxin system Phd/YefM family antitoxin [Rhizobium leucaenae]MBB4567055.1 prevent-host-death family protein [Rhizobium leucaenae]MBB6300865.1 prevent-host-death family protein [Rhizobium leucaenae]